jgi:thiamine biosynthesis lipoprotein
VRYHHIIDPATGKSPHAVRSVTVIGPDATLTEGLTKSLFILGPERGIALIDAREDVDAVIVASDGKVWYSKGLAPPEAAGTGGG